MRRVLVGMSGGVDSSVAAALLIDEGYEVMGFSINLVSCDRPIDRSCCSAADRQDARAVCEHLGVPHLTVDERLAFRDRVVGPFVEGYLGGCTPSPCIACNEYVKFRALLHEANRLGYDFIATGHYARVERDAVGMKLLKGIDVDKDQSYFLCRTDQRTLARTLFPLGAMTKKDVRLVASAKRLPVHAKPESQEVCFIPDDDYVAFIESRAGERLPGPGDFVDASGRLLGRHRGIHAYTIGQRRGLGLSSVARWYVLRIDKDRNKVVLGSDEELSRLEMDVHSLVWVGGIAPSCPNVTVKIRSTHAGVYATIKPCGEGRAHITFTEPVRAVAPGQAAVFYNGDELLGGGWIE